MEGDDAPPLRAAAAPWWRRTVLAAVRSYLFASVATYLALALVFGGVLHAIQKAHTPYRFIDTLYSAVSALTVTGAHQARIVIQADSQSVGLITIDTSTLRLASQIVIFFLILLGSTQLMSVIPVALRAIFLRRWLQRKGANFADRDTVDQLNLELRALRKLQWIILAYFLVHVIGGGFIMSLYNSYAHDGGNIAVAIKDRRVSPWFAGFFLSVRRSACSYPNTLSCHNLQMLASLFSQTAT